MTHTYLSTGRVSQASVRQTHTCDKAADHPEPSHHCPVCGNHWTAEARP